LPERIVAGEGGSKPMSGQKAKEEPSGGAGVSAVEYPIRFPELSDALYLDDRSGLKG
jgi:hypothetical protein